MEKKMNEIFYIKEFPGNAYRWVGNKDDMSLQTAPLWKDGSIDHEQWGEVSEMTEGIQEMNKRANKPQSIWKENHTES